MTLNEFIEIWWDAHPGLEHTVMGQNGQFDELPHIEYEENKSILSTLEV